MTLVQDWFDVIELEPGVFAIEEPLHVERVKSHLVIGTERAVLIDTGMGIGNIRAVAESLTDLPISVVNSHAHWDHVGGNHWFTDIAIHPAEAADLEVERPNERVRAWFALKNLTGPLPASVDLSTMVIRASKATSTLEEGDVIDLGGCGLEVLHCPGHSPGGIVLLDRARGIMFSTDVAYLGYLYAYQGPQLSQYVASLERLAGAEPVVRVLYPSHNDAVVKPGVLPLMAEALRSVQDGVPPTSEREGVRVWDFGEVGVYLFPPRP